MTTSSPERCASISRRAAERFRRAVRESSWNHAGRPLEPSVSIGVYASRGDDSEANLVMRAANDALRAARARSGDQVVMHDPTQRAGEGKPLA